MYIPTIVDFYFTLGPLSKICKIHLAYSEKFRILSENLAIIFTKLNALNLPYENSKIRSSDDSWSIGS